jgi:hypothetical protein
MGDEMPMPLAAQFNARSLHRFCSTLPTGHHVIQLVELNSATLEGILGHENVQRSSAGQISCNRCANLVD